jgi:hypothetical protein
MMIRARLSRWACARGDAMRLAYRARVVVHGVRAQVRCSVSRTKATVASDTKWIVDGGVVRQIRAIRHGEVCLKLPRDRWARQTKVLASASVYDTKEAAIASLNPVMGCVIRGDVLTAELVIGPRGDGSYMPVERGGFWAEAFASKRAALTHMLTKAREAEAVHAKKVAEARLEIRQLRGEIRALKGGRK